MPQTENFISVDIETSGPIPGEYSLLSIGACVVNKPELTFEKIVKPINSNFDPEALKVTGFDMNELMETGEEPETVFLQFSAWLNEISLDQSKPVFVGFNASFDWSFVNYYFHKFVGNNPFGFAPLDIKALYMGVYGTAWGETKSSLILKKLKPKLSGTHNALDDAKFQAELFRLILRGK